MVLTETTIGLNGIPFTNIIVVDVKDTLRRTCRHIKELSNTFKKNIFGGKVKAKHNISFGYGTHIQPYWRHQKSLK